MLGGTEGDSADADLRAAADRLAAFEQRSPGAAELPELRATLAEIRGRLRGS
jgi:hypothetical protein